MKPRVTGMEVLPITVSERTTWRFVRLTTNVGVSGLGEASAGDPEVSDLESFYGLLGDSLSIQAYRRAGLPRAAAGGVRSASAFSAIEQALWDIRGKLLGAPVHELLGGRVRDAVPLYANVNRMTRHRVPEGFAESAALACDAGFQAVKAAPFDGFPPPDAGRDAIEIATTAGIDAMLAIRAAVGGETAVKVDCHSAFDFSRAVSVAERLRPVELDWYEEPLPVDDVEGMRELRGTVDQRLAGGERRFALDGFLPLITTRAVDVLMPDITLCGGVLEMLHIARAAETHGITISPHNARGPVATAVALSVCAAAANVESLELQWGEVDWRSTLIEPPEQVDGGMLAVHDGPGFGIELRI
ncbi:MAG: mandelate racemase/muconate lactonizing enzyme family protein [Gammaproteobacteria bacterium]|nr:mandelate racemase/muconate lactonizing enzyme family protein [Gammaproteobacteria bacterium]